MRTKDEILKDAGVSTLGMMSTLGLEVSIDIRDILSRLVTEIGFVEGRLKEIRGIFGGIK